jgi:hypothetical protein
VHLGSETRSFESFGVKTLLLNEKADWSTCLAAYLDKCDTKYVLILLDDFFLRGRVQTPLVLGALDFAIATNALQVRLAPVPPPRWPAVGSADYGEYKSGDRYRVSAQAAIWDKSYLRSLVRPGENPWTFEHNGTDRANSNRGGHFGARRPLLPYAGWFSHHVVEKGCWLPSEKIIFREPKWNCNFNARPTLPFHRAVQYQLARLFVTGLQWLPPKVSDEVRLLARSIMQKYTPKALASLGGR